jgi:hypothetical protein
MSPKLYIIMRKDLFDNSPGKMMAQSAHAQADFSAWMRHIRQDPDQYGALIAEFDTWLEDRAFGVTLTLHEPLATIEQIIHNTDFSGKTVDPTYPWRNYYGDLFVSNEVTCAWVFLCNESNPCEEEYMRQFGLHK